MEVGWRLKWVVVTLLVAHLVWAAADNNNIEPHRSLQAQSSLFTDTQALLSFKHKIAMDPHGLLNQWNLQIHPNCCDWFGITCTNARVISINLNGCGLGPALYDPIASLQPLDQLEELHLANNSFHSFDADPIVPLGCGSGALTTLDLSSNSLNSNFSTLHNCKSLVFLNMSRNTLHGAVPSSKLLGDASSLRWLDLSHNNFSGALSSDIFLHCGTLSWLDLSSNSLVGSIPSGISRCTTLQHLDISFNGFNGTLPTDIFPLSSNTTSNLISLQLSSNNISGSPPLIASCANLTFFDASKNLFTGNLTPFLSRCTSLHVLNLSRNAFTGNQLPTLLTSLVNLKILSVSHNNLTGTIWPGMGDTLLALQELHMAGNDLVGTIPPSFSNCTNLHLLNLRDNSLSGNFPVEVVNRMPALTTLILSFNFITGTLPASLGNASSLLVLDISANSLTGPIPGTICSPSLRKLLLADNHLYGAVPLESCKNLAAIDVSCNFINKTFPRPLPALPYMQELIMWGNLIAEEIPSEICSAAGQLRLLVLNANLINGTLPPTLANCSRVEWLSLSSNLLSGHIPPELGLMPRLGYLHLNNNSLSGTIPPSLGDCRYLAFLDLSSNRLEGQIPPELAKSAGKVYKGALDEYSLHLAFFKYLDGDPCTQHGLGSMLMMREVRPERVYRIASLQNCYKVRLYLDVAPYYIPGPPESLEGGSITYIDLSHNRLHGTIPEEIGMISYITVLSLAHNNLTGKIPVTLANLVHCTILHLDHNHLQGPIPPGLSELGVLNQLDLSSNNLSGSIPDSGKLPTFPDHSFASNPYLCGTPLPDCETQASIYGISSQEKAASKLRVSFPDRIALCAAVLFSVLLLIMPICTRVLCCRSTKEPPSKNCEEDVFSDNLDSMSARNALSINIATFEKHLRKLTYQNLWEATNGFSNEAIIGKGGFGYVYKASIANGAQVAIKKLAHPVDHPVGDGDKQFIAEMETIGKIKHRNLVPLLGYCRTEAERLLVYQYMEGGSLHDWLHGNEQQQQQKPMELNWERRKRVALGMAKGLCFLHHSCIPRIIHRDFKSGNVLLDDTFEARISDFGMALLLSAYDQHVSVSRLVGTPGYVPPEYCQSTRCTRQGDVYSFGVVLLELITGRSPTGDSRRAGANCTTYTNLDGNGNNVDAQTEEQEDGGEDYLVGWVNTHVTEENVKAVLDNRALHGGLNSVITTDIGQREREMLAYLRIACQCVHEKPGKRPSMMDVITGFREIHRGEDLDLLQ